jgi:uncharacterized membrane protein
MELNERQAAFFIGLLAVLVCVGCYRTARTDLVVAMIVGIVGTALILLVGAHYEEKGV